MSECRILWNRYELAMDRHTVARTATERAAWWAEANEWLTRYFDAVDRQLERDLDRSVERQEPALKPVAVRLILRAVPDRNPRSA